MFHFPQPDSGVYNLEKLAPPHEIKLLFSMLILFHMDSKRSLQWHDQQQQLKWNSLRI